MKNTRLGFIVAVALFSGLASAAEPPTAAPDRATYQQEVRAALVERGWEVTQDRADKLTAERLYIKQNGTPGPRYAGTLNTYARLQIYLQADDKGHSAGAAYASYCYYEHPNKDTLVFPPTALHDPKLRREYQEIVAQAKSHLAAGGANKVALK